MTLCSVYGSGVVGGELLKPRVGAKGLHMQRRRPQHCSDVTSRSCLCACHGCKGEPLFFKKALRQRKACPACPRPSPACVSSVGPRPCCRCLHTYMYIACTCSLCCITSLYKRTGKRPWGQRKGKRNACPMCTHTHTCVSESADAPSF